MLLANGEPLMTDPITTKSASRRPRRMAREPSGDAAISPETALGTATGHTRITKTDLLLALLRREQGATLAQMVAATGWLAHTTRAALSGLKKKGHVVHSDRVNGLRTYRILPAGDAA